MWAKSPELDRFELSQIIARVIKKMAAHDVLRPARVFNDSPCDATTEYAVGEEA